MKDKSFEEFLKNLLLSLVFPFIVVFLMVLWRVLILWIRTRKFVIYKTQIINLAGISFWLLQPEVCKVLFASFACIDVEGEQRMLADLDIKCW